MSTYHRDSALCGICHDVSNPFRGGFAIERTYTEWLSSSYPGEGWTCNSCHLPGEVGTAANTPEIRNRIVHQHELAGGNTWMPLVLAGEYPQLDREEAFQRTAAAATRQLQESSANLVVVAPTDVLEGSDLELVVRVENLTGHKLPTGYSEGRRCWLDVVVQDADGRVLLHSGAYDDASARRVSRAEDPQLRTYEARMSAGGVEGFHFVLQDGLIEDTRIPPRGFTPTDETVPVGRDYPVQPDGSLAHWDEAPYRIRVPGNTVGPLAVRATLRYQTASREYVELLRDENHTDDNGSRMFELWERYDRSPPVDMLSDGLTVTVIARPDTGCDVVRSGRSSGNAVVLSAAIGLLALGRLRRWRRSALRRSLPWRA